MSRDFNKQRPDDRRSSSRQTPSGHNREERPSYAPRPRLSRDAVDRAWENGASRTHADYRPRQTPNTPPAQRQGQPSSRFERSQPAYNRRPYEPRQEYYRGPSSPNNHDHSAPSANGDRRFHQPGQHAPEGQSGLNSQRWNRYPTEQENHRGPDAYRDERRPQFRETRGPAAQQYSGRPPGRPYERKQERFNNQRQPGGANGTNRRDSYNPRWQTRPTAQRQNSYQRNDYQSGGNEYQAQNFRGEYAEGPRNQRTRRDDFNGGRRDYQPGRQDYSSRERNSPAPREEYRQRGTGREAEQFEGDYEYFGNYEHQTPREQRQTGYRPGPGRPEGQNRQRGARFLTEQAEASEAIAEAGTALPAEQTPASLPEQSTPRQKKAKPRVVRTVQTVKPTMKSKHSPKVNKRKHLPHRPQGPVTRPSQRGYKWPTAEE